MDRKHPDLRIISRVFESKGSKILDYLTQILEGIDMENPEAVLRASQDIATYHQAVMFQFRKLFGTMFDRGVIQQFRSDIERLWMVGFYAGFVHDLIAAYTEFESVEKVVLEYFHNANYYCKRGERYVMPMLPIMNWKYSLACLRSALQKEAKKISIVGEQNIFSLVIDNELKDAFASRRTLSLRPMGDLYALCGVHGGRDTGEYTIVETLDHFQLCHRVPLTLMEAVQFYAAHPRFLLEQERVILLGEEYPTIGGMKYAFLSSPQSDSLLRAGLVSNEEADKVFVTAVIPSTVSMKKFFHYGKPSAAAIVVS